MAKLEKTAQSSGKQDTVLGVRITHPDRVVFPEAGCTKGDVAAYYAKAADRMLEHAGHRPVSLLRCPEGIDGECFFQKHAGKGFPSGIARVDLTEKSGKTEPYMVIEKRQGFVAAAQMGTIEFHIWGSRTDMLETPDRLVFDIDPDEGLPFSDVKAAASDVRKLLEHAGLQGMPMVTGGKGVHVIVPLRRTTGWETVAAFSRTVATCLAERHPDRYVATMSKARRKGRIFIDWLRNERGGDGGCTLFAPGPQGRSGGNSGNLAGIVASGFGSLLRHRQGAQASGHALSAASDERGSIDIAGYGRLRGKADHLLLRPESIRRTGRFVAR